MKKLNRKAQGMSEYLIILALVAVATIGAVMFFADNARDQIATIAEELSGEDADVAIDATRQAAARFTSYDLDNYTDSDE